MNPFAAAVVCAAGFVLGSLPFSVWIGRKWLGVDIRDYGDHNPGATNVLRAGGWALAALAATLDALKAAIPAGIAWLWLGYGGLPLALIAAAPIAGHAFSPFLHGKGGKAVAATFGMWAGLTVWEGPTVLGLGLVVTTRNARPAWAVLSAMLILFLWFALTPPSWNRFGARPPLSVIAAAWALNFAIVAWKHRTELTLPLTRGDADDANQRRL